MLVFIRDLGMRKTNGQDRRFGLFLCHCGTEKELITHNVKRGHTKSCGCLFEKGRKKGFHKIHGLSNHSLFKVWNAMKNRCYNSATDHYIYYGARGIIICEEWLNNFKVFYDWCMANGYKRGLQIDRIENDGNYEPSNCRFVDNKQNGRNTRRNVFIEINNEKKTIAEWAEISGIKYPTLYNRFKKGFINDILNKQRISRSLLNP